MKKILCVVTAVVLFASIAAAGEHETPAKPHPLFDRLKPLVGKWEATVGGQKVYTSYAIGSNGSTIVENLMPEGPAMLDVIHADGDALMMTHYCAGASQPRMRATKFEGNTIDFKFHDGTNLGDSYMSAVKLTLVDNDHLVQEWTNVEKGKTTPVKFEWTRVK